MVTLTAEECRVLGVLVEKAHCTPQQYPMTLNSLTTGCNQKNARSPVTSWDEDRVFDAVDGLRRKGLVREVMLSGSRVSKFRHVAREVLNVSTQELVILAELMLRGPQTAGDLRANGQRMHALESLEMVQGILDNLRTRPEPLVRELPGQRARRFGQLLCPTAHRLEEDASEEEESPSAGSGAGGRDSLTGRVEQLEAQVVRLTAAVRTLASSLGSPDPMG